MKVKEQLLGLKAYSPGKTIDEVKREYGLSKIIKLASNENPFGSSPKVMEAIQSLQDKFALYPDGSAYELRHKIANHLGVNGDQILFGSGLDEVIQILSRAFLNEETNVVMAKPTFSEYHHHAVIEKAEIREVPLLNGTHDLEGMLARIDEKTKLVWICNPNNPTGTYINEETLRSFLDRVPKTALVILDEAYGEYVTASDFPNSVALVEEYENVVMLHTFSKAFGLAALRIGYAVGRAELIQQIEPSRLPFNTSTLAQSAAIAALEDTQFLEACIKNNREGLQQYYDFCDANGITYYSSQANFIFMEVGDGNKVFGRLLEEGYIVRSGAGLGLPTGIRVTIGKKEDNEALLNVLQKVLEEEKVEERS
ncbi:histidinol-phosphate transaminase [Ectobacillus polymachus]|uniref:histidinol-phosphate transaminase n=1 Tax=Ectobacillus polymachus TaxID=1508806 RepID=UPI003A847D9B